MSLKHKLLALTDFKVQSVYVNEWNEHVHVRTLSGADRAHLLSKYKDGNDLAVEIVIACLCDEKGSLVFNDDDKPALLDKSASALDKIALAALELNGLTQKSIDVKKITKGFKV